MGTTIFKATHVVDKPRLRGHFHQAAFFIALGACTMLIARSQTNQIFLAMFIYSFSLLGMFGISALYHRPKWGEVGRKWMKRFDHAAIYVLIAGTGTPICLLSLPLRAGLTLLTTIWVAAGFGILKSLFWLRSPNWVSAILYVSVGWIYMYYLSDLTAALGPGNVTLLIVGGLVYTIGACIYAARRPNPWPRTFGYHEVFHVMVIGGATLHFLVIYSLT